MVQNRTFPSPEVVIPTVAALLVLTACESEPVSPEASAIASQGPAHTAAALDGSHQFEAPVFDIAAMPNGGILVAESPTVGDDDLIATVWEIRRQGNEDVVRDVVTIPMVEGVGAFGESAVSPLNGLEVIGQGNFFALRGGMDQAVGSSLWRASQGNARLVADIGSWELANDPDATQGPRWKHHACEAAGGFTAGPQSNPFHLTALSGGEVLIGDAAGNAVLRARTNGDIDWVALPLPATADGTGSTDPEDWLVWAELSGGIPCYVQPVPTSVAIGPEGDYYVGELTGVTAENLFESAPSPGLSRVWRIDAGANNVLCPSDQCEVAISGLTSVMDVEFGPDGSLYVVEYDLNDWFNAIELGNAAGGTIRSCAVTTGEATDAGDCAIIAGGLTLPGAITFDKWDNLWVLENNLGIGDGLATVRPVHY